MYSNSEYGMSFKITKDEMVKFPLCYKTYKRNGKIFWRNYKRTVKGGISILDYMAIIRENTAAAIIAGLSTNIYS